MAVVARLVLGLPLLWGLLLGFVVAAVSPAVVVPSLLDLQDRGYGVVKGIPTMILAAATLDDVLAITGFGAVLSLIFADSGQASVVESLVRAPLELAFGLGVGVVAGSLCAALVRAPAVVRFCALTGLGLSAVLGGWAIGLAGGGSLAAMTMGAVSARGWRAPTFAVARGLGWTWTIAQPVLVGLIGAAAALTAIEPGSVMAGLIILAVGLTVRLLVTFLVVSTDHFTARERFFVAVAWIPKATVQAAIGALALDLARQTEAGPQAEIYGTQVLTIAVMAIICTAPLGALGIAWSGPRWLERRSDQT